MKFKCANIAILIVFMAFLSAGCGSSGGGGEGGEAAAGEDEAVSAVSTIFLTATPDKMVADGAGTSTIKAVVNDSHGDAVEDGEVITFSVTSGTGKVLPLSPKTVEGVATVTYTASNTAGTETITAKATNNKSKSVDILLGNLAGTVCNDDGTPASGADIYVFSSISTSKTGEDGRFVFDVKLSEEEEVHAILVSKPGNIDSYQTVVLTKAGSAEKTFLLQDSDVSPVTVFASNGSNFTSNSIDGYTAKLTVPIQTSGFGLGSDTGITSAKISLEYIDITTPLPVPLPSPDTLAPGDVLIGDKQSPSVLVAVKPALLNMGTAATLTLPNPDPDGLPAGTRILRFDPGSHLWVDNGITVDATPADGTDINITKGGIYGIFYELEPVQVSAVKGDANPGSLVFLGDEVYEVPDDGKIYIDGIHVPSDGSLEVTIYDPNTGIMSQSTVTPVLGEVKQIIEFTHVPSSLSLALTQTTVKSDNSDSSTITATILDSSKVPIEGATVTFTANGGQISASTVDTDANGEAKIIFSSGTAEKKNQVVTITASVADLDSKLIPVQITGTTITLSTNNTALEIDAENPGKATAALTITVKDAGEIPVFDVPVTMSLDDASTGTATFSPSTGNTDVSGQLVVDVTGTGPGDVTMKVEALGATATQTYTIGAVGEVFGIIEPAEDIVKLSTGENLTITVKAPDSDQSKVVFATTFGAWDGGTDMVITKAKDVNNVASATLSSSEAGMATVQVYYEEDPSTMDSLTVAISAPSSEAAQIMLQASSTVVVPSAGNISNTVTLTATVKNDKDQVVGNAPVAFSIENPTGGGETVSPAVVYTDESGVATSTFTSGSLSSGAEGVTVKAVVVGMPDVNPASISIVIGGTAGSVVIGQSSKIISVNEDSAYQLPMTVLVADSNGNSVAGAQVSLSAWPSQYAKGYWVEVIPGVCVTSYNGFFANEDTNRNLILDANEDNNKDAILTPPNSAAGTLPAIVTTDENGVANFNLVYLKASAAWIEDEITASTLVLGTETKSTYTFWLPWLKGEECSLPHSPYNDKIEVPEPEFLSLSLSDPFVKSDNSDSSTITALVLGSDMVPYEGITVTFETSGGQISASTVDANADGEAKIIFSSGTAEKKNQVVTITALVAGLAPKSIPVQITGTTVTLSTDNANLEIDAENPEKAESVLTITTKDAGQIPIFYAPVTVSVVQDISTGTVTLSPSTGNTDVSGQLVVDVTGTGPGNVTVKVDALGAIATQKYTIGGVGEVFGIIAPAEDIVKLSTGENLTITVKAPDQSKVVFATTFGAWDGGMDMSVTKDVVDKVVSAVFNSSGVVVATVQVCDADNLANSDTLEITITAPFVDATRITLQSSTYVVAPTSGGISNTATLTATVRNSDLQVVGKAPVAFSIENPTGGGETVSPVVVYTDDTGVATTTFTSGSLPSVEPVIVSARVVDEGTTGPLTNILSFNKLDPDTITRSDGGSFATDGFEDGEQIRVQGSASNNGIYIIEKVDTTVTDDDTLTLVAGETLVKESAALGVTVSITAVVIAIDPGITIGGTAGSVVIGRGSEITVLSPTTYALPMSVLVADSNGNVVSGALVSLSVWPAQYSAGAWYDEDPDPDWEKFVPYISGTFDNEDLNENTFLDPGEDTNGDDLLTPPNSAAGTLPATVTTGENGVANFDLVYLKDHANWIRDRIRASTFVLGTETTSSITFRLSYALEEGEAGDLNDSPYPVGLTVTAGLSTTPYTFPVFTNSVTDTFTPIYGAITGQRTYTYTEPGTGSVNDVITDWITIIGSAIDPETGASSPIGTIVPVQIIVK